MMNRYQALCRTSRRAFWFALSAILLLSSAAQAMYDPHHGRWFQRDPLGVRPDAPSGSLNPQRQYADGWNLHQYVQGRPIAVVDPWGLRGGPNWRYVPGLGDLKWGDTAEISYKRYTEHPLKYDQPWIDAEPYQAGLTGDPQAAAAGVQGVRVVGGEPEAEMKKFMNEHKDFTK